MLNLQGATIDCAKDVAKIYEHARGEDDPIKFPLRGVNVIHNGGRAVIQIPQPGKAAFVLDRIKCSEPERITRNGKTTWVIAGASERLYMQSINPEDATVSFTVTDYEAGLGSVSMGVD